MAVVGHADGMRGCGTSSVTGFGVYFGRIVEVTFQQKYPLH